MLLTEVIDSFFTLRRRLAGTTQTNYQYAFRRLVAFFGKEC
jgi:hypothetical protein